MALTGTAPLLSVGGAMGVVPTSCQDTAARCQEALLPAAGLVFSLKEQQEPHGANKVAVEKVSGKEDGEIL